MFRLTKKEDKGNTVQAVKLKVVLFSMFSILFFIMGSYAYAQSVPDVVIELSTDNNYYSLGENIEFRARNYISNVLVLSLPFELEVEDPLGNIFSIDMVGHTNGEYRGTFLPEVKGTYKATAIVDINGQKIKKTMDIIVLGPEFKVELEVPKDIKYKFGPVDITGKIKVSSKDQSLNKKMQLMIMSPSSPFYNHLCYVQCNGQCDFSCTLGKNIELSKYYIIAKTTHNGIEQFAKSQFSLVLPETQNLNISFVSGNSYYNNKSQAITLEVLFNNEPLRDAMVNIDIITPDNVSRQLLADELLPGKYTVVHAAKTPGLYNIKATVVKGQIFGSAYGNYSLVEPEKAVTLSDFGTSVDVSTLNLWKTASFNITTDSASMVDLTGFIDEHTNLSHVYLIVENTKTRLNISSLLLDLSWYSKIKNTTMYIEAKLDKRLDDDYANITMSSEGDIGRVSVRLMDNSSYGNYKIPYQLEDDTEVAFIYDDSIAFTDNWEQTSNMLFLHSSSLINNIFFRSLSSDSIRIGDVVLSQEKVLQKEKTTLSVLFDRGVLAYNTVYIYNPDGNLVSYETFEDSFTFTTTNKSLVGRYDFIIVSKDYDDGTDAYHGRFYVVSSRPSVSIENEYDEKVQRNNEVFFEHIVRNNNFKDQDIIDLSYSSNFTDVTFYDEKGNMLVDTDRDGLIDTGLIDIGGKTTILVKALVPSNTIIGSHDDITIVVSSSLDEKVRDITVDSLDVVAFTDDIETHKDNLELLSIELLSNNLIAKVKNHDNVSKVFNLKADLNSSSDDEGLSKTYESMISPEEILTIVVPNPYLNESFSLHASIVGVDGNILDDDNKDDNKRIFIYDPSWVVDDLDKRIPLKFREAHYTDHNTFVIKAYVEIDDGLLESIVPVMFDGTNHQFGNFLDYDYDTEYGYGNILVEFRNVPSGLSTIAQLYYGDNKTDIGYENKKFINEFIMNNDKASQTGRWINDRQVSGYYGADYLHDLNTDKGWKLLNYRPQLELDNYELYAIYPSHDSFANNVPLLINTKDGVEYLELNQQTGGGKWNYLGAYDFDKSSHISLGNFGTQGLVVADAFMFRKVSSYASATSIERLVNGSIIVDGEQPTLIEEKTEKNNFEENISSYAGETIFINISSYHLNASDIGFNASDVLGVRLENSVVYLTPEINYTGVASFIFYDRFNIVSFTIDIVPSNYSFENMTPVTMITSNVSLNNSINLSNVSIMNITGNMNISNISNISSNVSLNISFNQSFLNGTDLSNNTNLTYSNQSLINQSLINQSSSNNSLNITVNVSLQFNGSINLTKNTTLNVTRTLNGSSRFKPKQMTAEVNKPVVWTMTVNSSQDNFTEVELPKEADKLIVVDKENKSIAVNLSMGNATLSLEEYGKVKEKDKLEKEIKNLTRANEDANVLGQVTGYFKEVSLKSKLSAIKEEIPDVDDNDLPKVLLSNKSKTYNITYVTDAPRLREGIASFTHDKVKKNVTVYSNVSMHYYNVTTKVDIPKARPEQVKIFWKINGTRKNIVKDPRFNVILIDEDDDGLIEKARWITPRLSEQNFEIEIDLTVLNIQSYPTLFNNWTVNFETIGKANLTITTLNTTWTEILSDNLSTEDDLNFLDLVCGNDSMKSGLLVVLDNGSYIPYGNLTSSDSYIVSGLLYPNWECNSTAHLHDQVITTGKHHLKFEFGDEVGYANNYAYMLYETFESYSTGENATNFVDYSGAAPTTDRCLAYDTGSSVYYRCNASTGGFFSSQYNTTNALTWNSYEARTKFRITQDRGTEGAGLCVNTEVQSSDWICIYNNNPGQQIVAGSSGVFVTGDFQSGVIPTVGTWYNMKVQYYYNGTHDTVLAKIWNDSVSEPGAWQINISNEDWSAPLQSGSVALYFRDAAVDYEYLIAENMSHTPVLTINQPRLAPNYNIGESVNFNVSMDKSIKNCTYSINGGLLDNLTLFNSTSAYDSQSFGSFGLRTVKFFCEDNFGNVATATRSFQVGSTPAGTFLVNATDKYQYSFLYGEFDKTYFNDTIDAVQLNNTYNNGTYTSQVFFSGVNAKGFTSDWINMSWTSNLEDGELPDDNAAESGSAGMNMSGNVLLYHMNTLSTSTTNPTYIRDDSGILNHGNTYMGISRGYVTSNMRIRENGWNGGANNGEFDYYCDGGDSACWFTDGESNYTGSSGDKPILDFNRGTPTADGAAYFGYVMYSEEDVFARFSANPPLSSGGDHFVGVCYSGGNWYYDDNNACNRLFTPVESDLLIYEYEQRSGTAAVSFLENYSHVPELADGKFSKGFDFDGDNDHLFIQGDQTLGDDLEDEFTLTAWIKPDSTAGQRRIISNDFAENSYYLELNGGNLVFGINDGAGGFNTVSTAYTASAGKWTLVSAVYDGTDGYVYINGLEKNSGALGVAPDFSNRNLSIGSMDQSSGAFFDGVMDEVAIWNRSLNSTEIANIFARGGMSFNLSARTCSAADCSDASFVDIGDSSPQTLSLPDRPYIQYRFEYFTDSVNISPELYNVSLFYELTPPVTKYFDNFKVDTNVSNIKNISLPASSDGGAILNYTCLSYPFEAGCWSYKQRISLTETDVLDHDDYSFNLEFDSVELIDDGKMEGNCTDIRVTWVNESSGVEEEVYFWVEEGTCPTTETQIWINAPYLNASDSQIYYMYYGNPSATRSTKYDMEEIFYFADDFSGSSIDGSKWDVMNAWYSFPGDGTLQFYSDSNDDLVLASDDDFNDGTLYWRVQTIEERRNSDITVEIRESNVGDNDADGYCFVLNTDTNGHDGIWEEPANTLLSGYGYKVSNLLWVRAKATFDGPDLTFWNDFHDVTLTATDSTHTQGKLAIGMLIDQYGNHADRQAWMDWIGYLNRTSDSHSAFFEEEIVNYKDSGTFESKLINPDYWDSWEYLTVDHTIPDLTNISYMIYDGSNNLLCDFEVDEAITEYDISGCAYNEEEIKIVTRLQSANASTTPLLSSWKLSWIAATDVIMDEPHDNFLTRFSNFYMNGSLNSTEAGCDIEVTSQYKLIGQSDNIIEDEYSEFITYDSSENISIANKLTLLANSSTSTWYDYRWPYRKQVNVSLPTTETGYQILLNFTALDVDFTTTNSFTNIRFTYLNKTTNIESEIPHFLESYDGTNAIIWVKVPYIEAGLDSSLFMYYGYSDAIDSSSGDDTFMFYDDFLGSDIDSLKWSATGTGAYSVSGSEFIGENDPSNNDQRLVYTNNFEINDTATVDFTMRAASNQNQDWDAGIGIGPAWGFSDEVNNDAQGLYISEAWWDGTSSSAGARRVWTTRASPHRYRVQVNGTHAQFKDLDDGRQSQLAGDPTGALYIINMGINDNSDTIIDWIYTRKGIETGTVTMSVQENVSFYKRGEYVSNVLDTEVEDAIYGEIDIESDTPSGTNFIVYTRTSEDDTYWTSWEKQENSESITSDPGRYVQYMLLLNSSTYLRTPNIDLVSIKYLSTAPVFSDISLGGSIFDSDNPYDCGTMAKGAFCYPEWATVTPKQRGKFLLRLHGEGTGACSYDEYSNEKIVYVFANTQVDNFDSSDDPAAQGETILFSGSLIEDLGTALENKVINIYEGPTLIGRTTTDSSGYFSLSYQIPSDETIGDHTYKAVFEKDYDYYFNPSTSSTTVKVSSKPKITDVVINPDPIGNDQSVVINATVTDVVGLNNVFISITTPSSTVSSGSMNLVAGVSNYTYTYTGDWEIGTHIVKIIANNTDEIEATYQTTFEVEIQGDSELQLTKDTYLNYEDVLLQSLPADWWNQSWKYRIPLNLTTPTITTEDGFQVNLVINSTNTPDFDWSSSCIDIRFTNGTNDLLLDHWVESCDRTGQEASVWVRTNNSISPDGNLIYLYYGNYGAENVSDGKATFVFYDDFEDNESYQIGGKPAGWQDINNGNISLSFDPVRESWVINKSTSNDPSGGYAMMSETISNFHLSFLSKRVWSLNGEQNRYALGSGMNPSNGVHSGYGPAIRDWDVTNAQFDIERRNAWGGTADLTGNNPTTTSSNTWYKWELTRYNGDMTFNLYDYDGNLLDSVTTLNRNTYNTFEHFAIHGGYESYTDNIIVSKYVDETIGVDFGEKEIGLSGVMNRGTTAIKGYRWGIVQKYDSDTKTWSDVNPAVINDFAFGTLKTLDEGDAFDYATDWNMIPWNTDDAEAGTYRVKIALVDNSGSPSSSSAVLEDSNGNRLESFYNFTIKEALLFLNNITYPNIFDYGIAEYETTDTIDWINVTLSAQNNTAIDVEATLTLLDRLDSGYAGFGPKNETKSYGNIIINTNKTKTWDNSSNGYFIDDSLVTGTYQLKWKVEWELQNGPNDVNMTRYVRIHNIPSTFSTWDLNRLYINESVFFGMNMSNLWTSVPLKNVSITLNCPPIAGLTCVCNLSGQSGNTCELGNLTPLTMNHSFFNISAVDSVPSGNYYINFTVNYTNPTDINKSWVEVMPSLLEVRRRGIIEVVVEDYDTSIVRYAKTNITAYANNTGTDPVNDVWLNYTATPFDWSVLSGSTSEYAATLNPDEVVWSNVSFRVGGGSGLGSKKIVMNSSSPDGKPDFKELFITVYANTTTSPFTTNDSKVSVGETIGLTARLLWDNSTPLSGETIYFYNVNETLLIGSDVTDTSGYATIDYAIAPVTDLGAHLINATYYGKAAKYALASNRSFLIDIGLKPTIRDVSASPNPVGYGFNVTINANVTDLNGLDKIYAYVKYPHNSTYDQLEMQPLSADIYEVNFTNTWYNGTYSYYIWANDSSGSFNVSALDSFELVSDGKFKFSSINESYSQFSNVLLNQSHWWNNSYRYRQKIYVSVPAGSTQQGYQIPLVLNSTSVGDGFDWNNACDDLRFVNQTDTAELNYWTEYCNVGSQEAKVWVRLDKNLSTSQYFIYMYYGNDNAANASSAANTFDTITNYWQGWEQFQSTSCSGPADWSTYPFDNSIWSDVTDVRADFWGACSNCDMYIRKAIILTSVGDSGIQVRSDDGQFVFANGLFVKKEGGNCHAGGTANVYTNLTSWVDKGLNVIGVHCSEAGGGEYCEVDSWTFPNAYNVKTHYSQPQFTLDNEEYSPAFSTGIRAPLIAKIQRFNGGGWVDVETHIDDISTSTYRIVNTKNYLNLSSIWNPSPWNTANNQNSLYRVLAYFVSPYGDVLWTGDGYDGGSTNFTILPPETNVTIETIRLYNVNSSTKYSGGDLNGTGLNKSFTLYVNKTYRVEIELKNNDGSPTWNLSNVLLNHTGLNPEWLIDNSTDIWFRIGATSNNLSGNFTDDTIYWNVTDNTVSSNTKLILAYYMNVSNTSTGNYPVKFTVDDPYFVKSDTSEFVVTTEKSEAPKLYYDFFVDAYNMTDKEVIRTMESTKIFARWDEGISEAKVFYNATVSPIISTSLVLPFPNDANWTNYTFTPTSSWLLGYHVAQIQANNPAGVWNDTLSFIGFNVYGLAYLDSFNINASTIGIGESVNITCDVYDDTKDTPIQDYNVTIYSNGVLINSALTDANGHIEYVYTPPTFGIYNVVCNISEQGWYKTDVRYSDSANIFIKEFVPPEYHDNSGPSLAHKGDTVTLATRWTDNAQLSTAILATNETGVWSNVSTISVAGLNNWSNFSYTIGDSIVPDNYGWRQYGNDTSGNYNWTPPLPIQIWGWASINSTDVNPSGVAPGSFTKTTCQVIDANSEQGIASYNVSFWQDSTYLGWNLTNSTGYAKYGYHPGALGLHTIHCNITDDLVTYYNTSVHTNNDTLLVTNSFDFTPPFTSVYDINDTLLMRGECLLIYAKWSEAINYSRSEYNMTSSTYYNPVIPPYTNNWTNQTICTNESWSIGPHRIRLWANDSVGNINDTLSDLSFTMRSRSAVNWTSPFGIMPRGPTNFTCQVYDNFTKEGIDNYLIQFYGPLGFISSGFSNSTGHVTISHDTSVYGTGANTFTCNIVSNIGGGGYYITGGDDDEEENIITFSGSLKTNITNPIHNATRYRGVSYFLNATTTDDANSPITPDGANWTLSNGTIIATGYETSWSIPGYVDIGALTINVSVNKTGYASVKNNRTFNVWAYVSLNQSSLSPSKTMVNLTTTMSCQVIDNLTLVPIENKTVFFYSQTYGPPTGLGTALTDNDGWASLDFNYSVAAYENVTCRIYSEDYYTVTGPNLLREEINVSLAGIDMSVADYNIINNSCTYERMSYLRANISNNGLFIYDVNISFYVGGIYNQSYVRNFSNKESVIVNYTLFHTNESEHNYTIDVYAIDDVDLTNNVLLLEIDKYNYNVSLNVETEYTTDNLYNLTLSYENTKDCPIENASVFAFTPVNISVSRASPIYDTYSDVEGDYAGKVYDWIVDIPALGSGMIEYSINGNLTKYVIQDSFMHGLKMTSYP